MPTWLEELTLCSTEVRLLVFSMRHLHFSVFKKHYSSEWGSKCGEDKNVRYIYLVSASRDLHSMCGTLTHHCMLHWERRGDQRFSWPYLIFKLLYWNDSDSKYMTNTSVSANTAVLHSVAGPKTTYRTLTSGFSGTHWSRLAANIGDSFLNHIPSAVSVQCESSGFGQYLSVFKGTGASAGRRETDRQDRRFTWGPFNSSIRDHYLTTGVKQAHMKRSTLHHKQTADPPKVIQQSKVKHAVTLGREYFWLFPLRAPPHPLYTTPPASSSHYEATPTGCRQSS